MSWLKPTLLTLAVLAVALPALSEQMTFVLDSERSEVRILLGATLHTVPGSAPIGPATLTWDTESGEASGQVVIQSAELDTRIDARNAKMHEIVLKTLEHPEIIFEATGFELRQPGDDEMRFVLRGALTLVGTTQQIEFETHARRRGDDSWKARADLNVPYVEWGLEDPSMPLFGVDKHVAVEVKAIGTLTRK
jgi:polyisoprenoid-binding protein YceI